MSLNISGISPIELARPQSVDGPAKSTFKDMLSGAIDQVELSSSAAHKSVQQFLSGEGDDLHSTILSIQRADLEFQMLMQVRNKVVNAYQEVMRMQM